MKEYCVIFDTNILTENKKILNDIKSKLDLIADIFIPRIVVEEIQAQRSRNIHTDYLKIKAIIEKNADIFKYQEKFKIDEILEESESKIEKWFNAYCNNNIIDYNNIKINEILNRLKYKKAPFNNEIGSSDKGFKDSMIWISILKNKMLQNYKKIVLVTNDKTAFIKRTEELYDEYNKEHKVSLIICSNIEELYNNLGIIKLEKIEDNVEMSKASVNKIDNIDDLKIKLNLCVDNILYTVYEDDWGNEHCNNNFIIYRKMKEEDIECFLNLLGSFLNENLFFKFVDITELLKKCGVECDGENVSLDYLNQLNQIYNDLKDNRKLYNPFINYLKVEFNKLYQIKPIIIEDPFKDFGNSVNSNDDGLPF